MKVQLKSNVAQQDIRKIIHILYIIITFPTSIHVRIYKGLNIQKCVKRFDQQIAKS